MNSLRVEVVETLATISESDFQRLDGPQRYPFLRREWLLALESSFVVGRDAGWIVRHLAVFDADGLVAFVPGYLKLHSMGEFVFDQAWGQFLQSRLGEPYYPKWVFAVPFTPATGPRILFRADLPQAAQAELRDFVLDVVVALVDEMNLSSAHILFCDGLEPAGKWLERWGLQYQYHRQEDVAFEDYLKRLKTKRRTQVRRERRALLESDFEVEIWSGASLNQERARWAYELYLTTVDKYYYGRRYLNLAFFEEVVRTMPESLQMIVALRSGRVQAGVFNLIGEEALYGRYWGAFCDEPFLHFNLCLYEGVQYCLENRLERMEPGAGGEHKRSRGFEPTLTKSLHYLRNPHFRSAVADYLGREIAAVQQELDLSCK